MKGGVFHVMKHMLSNGSRELVLLYGQIPVNVKYESIIRSFLLLLNSIFIHLNIFSILQENPYILLRSFAYRTHKPEFVLDEKGRFIQKSSNKKNWNDYGCVILWSLDDCASKHIIIQ